MAGAGAGVSGGSNKQDVTDEIEGFAVAVVRDDGAWKVSALKPSALLTLDDAERQLRELRAAGAVFGLLDVDDEFFIVVRPGPSGAQLLISDATAGVDYDVAADALDAMNIDVPDLDPDELDDIDPWEEGDLGILADLGLPDAVMSVIVGDTDLYADEQLGMIAARLGFADELSKVLDSLGH
ncbi:tRNA adenosine deaminase-associated protein [Gordonia hankookensis]|uniref:tRNA adenosine deaminase-associated protein n=1 Tax=Gordonia hankookensis TaxID=589403 RepID=A0ABR7WBR3_9ACTN|nr:tRNA adenosine deaminase-associated protein [Gordonia hankookensis]MBD1320240.1 tRNA adenosine deaminase-associated protein [Gordonia hankookensis]NDZ95673.1 tRNA adenosine deaminase-associated protein [Streptomyces sp. SID11726]NEB25920.1 tRNA adenosine deaminase-associated protein [Streptomyces sp. SID6673]